MDDSIYRLRNHDLLLLILLAVLGFGVIMVQSASSNLRSPSLSAQGLGKEEALAFRMTDLAQKQVIFAGIGVGLFLLIRRTDYARLWPSQRSWWCHPPIGCLLIAGLMCVMVLIPGLGIEKNGARRWLPLGVMQVQPSELAKWGVVIFLAWWLTARPVDLGKFRNFVLTLVPIGLMCLLVVIQDFGTAALIGVVAFAMLLVGRVKLWHLAVVIPPALMLAFWFVHHKEYRWRRMTAFLDPYAAPQQEGYHMIQSLLSFATGGLSGTGIGAGIQKTRIPSRRYHRLHFCDDLRRARIFSGQHWSLRFYLGILVLAWQAVKRHPQGFWQDAGFWGGNDDLHPGSD
ncbi:MAG: hypothetical protein KatS3mg104_1056 [Phycisphaerae bacterium]|nr:MAG: hypothetical protein KatS3mg104_1056 [Phycisphaerae bacterium]